jgi:hypothetical protein
MNREKTFQIFLGLSLIVGLTVADNNTSTYAYALKVIGNNGEIFSFDTGKSFDQQFKQLIDSHPNGNFTYSPTLNKAESMIKSCETMNFMGLNDSKPNIFTNLCIGEASLAYEMCQIPYLRLTYRSQCTTDNVINGYLWKHHIVDGQSDTIAWKLFSLIAKLNNATRS